MWTLVRTCTSCCFRWSCPTATSLHLFLWSLIWFLLWLSYRSLLWPQNPGDFQYPRWVCIFHSTFYCFSTITIARLDYTVIMIHSNKHTYLLTSMGKNHHPMLWEWCSSVLLITVYRNVIPASSSAPSATTTDTPTISTTTSKSMCTCTIELLCISTAFSHLR